MCAPEKEADDAEGLMLYMVLLSPTVYVNYIETQFVTIRHISDLSEPPSLAQLIHKQKKVELYRDIILSNNCH